jgi:hypothetical protein
MFPSEIGNDTGLRQLVQRPLVRFVHATTKPFVCESLSQRFLHDVTRHRLVLYVFFAVIVQTCGAKGAATRIAFRNVVAAPARRFHPFRFVEGHFRLRSMYARGRLSQRFQKSRRVRRRHREECPSHKKLRRHVSIVQGNVGGRPRGEVAQFIMESWNKGSWEPGSFTPAEPLGT